MCSQNLRIAVTNNLGDALRSCSGHTNIVVVVEESAEYTHLVCCVGILHLLQEIMPDIALIRDLGRDQGLLFLSGPGEKNLDRLLKAVPENNFYTDLRPKQEQDLFLHE